MHEKTPSPDSPISTPPPAVQRPRRWGCWLAAAIIPLLAGAGVFVLVWLVVFPLLSEAPLEGELIVTLTRAGGSMKSLRIEDPGAVPVKAGDRMQLTARYNHSAYTYLVWLNSQGKVVPLYPWNQDSIDVKDFNQPPPACQPIKFLFNPMTIGNGWTFDKKGGLDTVLLLARRTPLDPEVNLGNLLGSPSPVKMRDRAELAVLALDRHTAKPVTLRAANRGSAEAALEVDRPLLAMMDKLRDQFELIRAVRFAHDGE